MTLMAQNERRQMFVFCIDYIDNLCINSYSLCLSSSKSINYIYKFELSAL